MFCLATLESKNYHGTGACPFVIGCAARLPPICRRPHGAGSSYSGCSQRTRCHFWSRSRSSRGSLRVGGTSGWRREVSAVWRVLAFPLRNRWIRIVVCGQSFRLRMICWIGATADCRNRPIFGCLLGLCKRIRNRKFELSIVQWWEYYSAWGPYASHSPSPRS